ncbi:MAG: hypothetical protein HY730_02830 [Candidatus Tectomicrobia bacterium]|uniref:Uncharacterized protein n=1 Tax=Tectimicrobiota bacterium TaxID=2528274 RepID=A0A933GK42_UNCTE|nr:hypothetical protein [Candidatus Tectomicrobia bacterium]
MPYLMHICFDSSSRLIRNVHYFEYRGVRFKLIQNNPRKWSDVLLTLVPLHDEAAQNLAFSVVGEFLSALSWQNHARIVFENAGGIGVEDGFRLRKATCHFFTFPKMSFRGDQGGNEISRIPEIENDNQRIALTLFREARSSNKSWLAFLFYWQIMEVGGGNPVSWIEKVYRKQPSQIYIPQKRQLPLSGRKLGEYLLKDCRDAIAHIRRRPGERVLRFDDGEENKHISISVMIVEQFAEYYIREVLCLKKEMHLVRRGSRGFPTFVKESEILSYHFGLIR